MSVEAELQDSVGYSPLQRMRHSAAHVMAEAVQEMFPDAKFAIGPAIEDGFYYDFDLPRPLTPADFPEIEQHMARIIAGKYPFVRDIWSRQKALQYFRDKGQPYKVEIIEQLPEKASGALISCVLAAWTTSMVPVVPLPMVSVPPVPGAIVYLLALSK